MDSTPPKKGGYLPPKGPALKDNTNGISPQPRALLALTTNYSARKIDVNSTLLGHDRYLCRGGSLIPGRPARAKVLCRYRCR